MRRIVMDFFGVGSLVGRELPSFDPTVIGSSIGTLLID